MSVQSSCGTTSIIRNKMCEITIVNHSSLQSDHPYHPGTTKRFNPALPPGTIQTFYHDKISPPKSVQPHRYTDFPYPHGRENYKDARQQLEVPTLNPSFLSQIDTFVPAVGAYSKDSWLTGIEVGFFIAFGISPVSGAPCDVRPSLPFPLYLSKIGPFLIIIAESYN